MRVRGRFTLRLSVKVRVNCIHLQAIRVRLGSEGLRCTVRGQDLQSRFRIQVHTFALNLTRTVSLTLGPGLTHYHTRIPQRGS